ncbi:MAG: hypothetical protein Q7V58_16330 [Actinomycetota bacterium]|nr:hypothetical protein [Actinomycetota bacterium]
MNPDPSVNPNPSVTPSPAGDHELRADAYEVFMAEAARVRLVDRSGPARVVLRCGVTLSGALVPPNGQEVSGTLDLLTDGRRVLVAAGAVVALVGPSAGLRDESGSRRPRTLAAWLRECWSAGTRVSALLPDGTWAEGEVVLVAADHVELARQAERWVVPFVSAEAWTARGA